MYRTQVLPLLDYGCILWDPHLSKHKQQLENVQLFSTRMASKQWNESAETLNGHFNLPPLTTRRKYFKLLYLCKLVNGYVFCPPGLFAYNPNSNVRISHSNQLIQPFARTSSFYNSFFISSVRAWNSLPKDVALRDTFKISLKLFYIIFNHLFMLFRVPFTLAFLLLGTCALCYHTVDAEKKLGRKCTHFVVKARGCHG